MRWSYIILNVLGVYIGFDNWFERNNNNNNNRLGRLVFELDDKIEIIGEYEYEKVY